MQAPRLRGCARALLALALALTAPAQALRLELLARDGGGALYRAGPQRVLVLKGDAREIGRQHGTLLKDEVRLVLREVLAATFRMGIDRPGLQAIADAHRPFVPESIDDELRGVADGAGVDYEELRLLHAMPEKFHCSGAAAAGSATADGKLYHTRSLDYALNLGTTTRLQNHAVLVVRVPKDGVASAVPAWAGFVGAVTGLNEKGVSIGEMGSSSKDEAYDGVPMVFLLRDALQRGRNLGEAVGVFQDARRTCGFNFIVASGDERKAVVVEVTRSKWFLSGMDDPAEDVAPHERMKDIVRRTNHFVGVETAATQRKEYDPRKMGGSSWGRYEALTGYLRENSGKLDARAMIESLRLYTDTAPCLHQAVMESTDRAIWVAQAGDDRDSGFAGAQNQVFVRYGLRELIAGAEGMKVEVVEARKVPETNWVVPEDAGLPRCEIVFSRGKKEKGTLVVFGVGDPSLRVERRLAVALSQVGVRTLIVPTLQSGPQDAARARKLATRPETIREWVGGEFAIAGIGPGAVPALALAQQLAEARHGTASPNRKPRVALLLAAPGIARILVQQKEAPFLMTLDGEALREWAKAIGDVEEGLAVKDGDVEITCLALRGVPQIPEAEQQKLFERLPGADVHWYDGGFGKAAMHVPDAVRRLVKLVE
jgi:hypothetical protein